MTIIQSLLLGIIEGLTEFIPVSSTGHMLVAQRILGIPATDSAFAFLVLVQMGPLVALLVYFSKDLWKLFTSLFARPLSSVDNRLAWCILLASAPALLAGALLKDVVQRLFQSPLLEAAIRFFAAAVLLLLAERLGRQTRSLDSLTLPDALMIGLFQVLAVFPGASRSGSAISGGMLRNFARAAATRFAFLMSAPVMIAAGMYESFSVIRHGALHALLLPLAVGILVAAVGGWLSIRWLIGYVSSHSLYVFAAYSALIGALCLAFLWI
jgi:undecaprenyl-diphosphatase